MSGAIYVKGARPGDTLEIDILKMEHKGWGWSGHIPHFGLLADDFDSAHLHHWELEDSICRFADGIELPAEPFPGVIGLAPRESGRLDTFPPRSNGGNLDTRDLVAGSTAWLPIHADGALNAGAATRYMIEWLGTNCRLEPADAYLLCSTAANLRIIEIVDAPNWIVSLHFPLDILR